MDLPLNNFLLVPLFALFYLEYSLPIEYHSIHLCCCAVILLTKTQIYFRPHQNQREQNYTVLKTRSNMMTVIGLKPGTTYVFRVRARTDGGYGSYGGEIELETSHEGKEREKNTKYITVCLCI